MAGQLWAGSDDGLIHVSDDGGAHWNQVTPDGLPQWSEISMIEPSHFDPATAYVAVDRHKLDDIAPYALRTRGTAARAGSRSPPACRTGPSCTRCGKTPSVAACCTPPPRQGVFVSFDDGAAWQPLQLDLPASPVHDLAISRRRSGGGHPRPLVLDPRRRHPAAADRRAGTAAAPVVLYTPQTALRLYYPDAVDTRRPVGENPPAGAIIDYAFTTDAARRGHRRHPRCARRGRSAISPAPGATRCSSAAGMA